MAIWQLRAQIHTNNTNLMNNIHNTTYYRPLEITINVFHHNKERSSLVTASHVKLNVVDLWLKCPSSGTQLCRVVMWFFIQAIWWSTMIYPVLNSLGEPKIEQSHLVILSIIKIKKKRLKTPSVKGHISDGLHENQILPFHERSFKPLTQVSVSMCKVSERTSSTGQIHTLKHQKAYFSCPRRCIVHVSGIWMRVLGLDRHPPKSFE